MNAYSHIPHSSRLQHYVQMVWEVVGNHNVRETILPQGIVEIIFNFAERVEGLMPFSNTPMQAPRCFVQGINTHNIHASYKGQHHLFGIRLHAHRVQDLLGILPSEVNNTTLDLTLLKPRFDQLWHQLGELNTFPEKVHLLEKNLPRIAETSCDRSKMLSDLFISDTIDRFQNVDELAKEVCYSTRQLNRVSHTLFGLSAEDLVIYKKFVRSVKLIHHDKKSLTDVAYSSGFYDQSHFCRVFKSYTGMTPNQYKKSKGPNPFHIISW